MTRTTLLTLTLLCPLPALAQQTYDLRTAGADKHAPGDAIRVVETERQDMKMVVKQGEQVMQRDEGVQGFEQTYVEEIIRVDDEGEVAQARRTYSAFTDLKTEQSLEGGDLVVELNTLEDGTRTVEYAKERTLPRALTTKLDGMAGKQEEPKPGEEPEEPEKKPSEIFTPAEPVAVGATWTVDTKQAIEGMGIDEQYDPAQSTCTGTLVSATPEGGTTWLTVKIDMKLLLTTMEGAPCPDPFVFEMTMSMRLPDGGGNTGTMTMDGTIVGSMSPPNAPPGVSVALDMKTHGDMRREAAPQTGR